MTVQRQQQQRVGAPSCPRQRGCRPAAVGRTTHQWPPRGHLTGLQGEYRLLIG